MATSIPPLNDSSMRGSRNSLSQRDHDAWMGGSSQFHHANHHLFQSDQLCQ
jgi:hypothetical protein